MVIRFRRPLLQYFIRRVGDRGEAEDLTQEVFVRILLRGPQDQIEHERGFIFTVAANLLRLRARGRGGRPRQVELSPRDFESGLVEDCAPDRILLGRERLWETLAHLDELDPKTRNIFLMFRVDRMRQRDIAKAYGVSVSAVEKHVARAGAHLVTRLQRTRRAEAHTPSNSIRARS